jgi:hypothetical protein
MRLSKGGRPRKNPSHDATGLAGVTTLKLLGISRDQSSKWQLISKVPEATFEKYLADCEREGVMPSTAGLVRLAKRLKTESRMKTTP